jgi:hypothetical protein
MNISCQNLFIFSTQFYLKISLVASLLRVSKRENYDKPLHFLMWQGEWGFIVCSLFYNKYHKSSYISLLSFHPSNTHSSVVATDKRRDMTTKNLK